MCAGLTAWPLFQGARESGRLVSRTVAWSALCFRDTPVWAGAEVDGAADGSAARGQAVSGMKHAEKLD